MEVSEFKQRIVTTGMVIALLAVAAFFWLGRWEGIGGGERITYVIDRWTGDLYAVHPTGYRKLEEID